MDGEMDGQTDGWTDGRMDGRTEGRMNERTDGWTGWKIFLFYRTCPLSEPFSCFPSKRPKDQENLIESLRAQVLQSRGFERKLASDWLRRVKMG